MSGSGMIARAVDIEPANLRELRRAGLALEIAASTLNGAAQRCEAGQGTIDDFERAVEGHDFARATFRDALERCTGLSAGSIERWLAL